MKRLMTICLATVLLSCLSSCRKDSKPEEVFSITGDWNITSVTTKSAVIGSQTVDVYLRFLEDGTFAMYQKTGSARYECFTGTWTLDSHVLGGKYSDGTPWAARYNVSREGRTMTLESITTPVEVSVYTETTIPQNVISEAI